MISRSKSAMAGSAGFPGAVTNQPLPGLPIRPSRQSSSERCGTPAAGRSDPKEVQPCRGNAARPSGRKGSRGAGSSEPASLVDAKAPSNTNMQVPITLVQVDTVSAAPDARAVDGHNQEASAAGLQVLAGRSPVFDLNGGSDQTLREQDSHLHRASTALAGPDAAAGDPRHRQPRTGLEQPGSRKGNNRGTLLGSEGQSDNRHGSGRPTPLPSVPWRHQLPESRRTRLLAALVDLETLCEVAMAAGGLLAVGWWLTHDLGTVWRWAGGIVR